MTTFLRASSFEPFLVEYQRAWMPLIYGYLPSETYYNDRTVRQLKECGGKIHDWMADVDEEPRIAEIPTKRLRQDE